MAGLDFDKMDELELFVRHFRHKISNAANPMDSRLTVHIVCEAIDFAWAEVSVRREREHAAWVNDRGLDTEFPFRDLHKRGGGK